MKRFIDICQFILVLMGLMICGLFVTSILGLLPFKGYSAQWVVFASQNIIAFIMPAILTWIFCFHTSPLKAMDADEVPSLRMIGIAILLYIAGMPALNQMVYWNQEMHLPETFAPFEDWCRTMEQLAEDQTKGLLSATGLFPTVMNILVIGVLTGIGEEFFFRGALQRMAVWCGVNHHIAIWGAAFIFSALHFQFFGFVPRLLLGALFGYLYWWSGSIWVNSFAHALNNSLVIVSTWCINTGLMSEDFDTLGVSGTGFPTTAAASIFIFGTIVFLLHHNGVLKGHATLPPEIPSKTIGNATENK